MENQFNFFEAGLSLDFFTEKSVEANCRKREHLLVSSVIKQVERNEGFSISELRSRYSDEILFFIGLKYVTTTKKVLCTALDIPIEAGCRYKRKLEKEGYLMQSVYRVICPLTKHRAHLISTNPEEYEQLLLITNNQIKMFW